MPVTNPGWKREFNDPIPPPRGRQLATLEDATRYIQELPKAEHELDDWRIAQDQVYTYERLKQEMERLKKHEDEQSFFQKELRSRRGLIRPFSGAWILNYIYEASSNYGSSIARPLLWLLGVFAVGFCRFAVTPVFNGARMTVAHAAMVSFANIFSFLPITREASVGLLARQRSLARSNRLSLRCCSSYLDLRYAAGFA
jgi:hypothetical protein